MPKILQFGDLHLGMENFGFLDPKSGLHTRFLDFLNTLDQIVEIAITERVNLVLFTGDAYKNANPSPTLEREFASRLNTLVKKGMEVFLLVGNHDMPASLNKANALDVFSALEIPGLKVIRQPGLYRSLNSSLQILALPWINPNLLLAESFSKAENLNKEALTSLENLFNDLLSEAKKHSLPTVVLIHGSVEGSLYPTGESSLFSDELILPRSWFFREPILLTSAGHLHKLQILTEKGLLSKEELAQFWEEPRLLFQRAILYTGAPDYIDFGEEKEKKCVAIIEIQSPQKLKLALKPLKTRPLKTIKITLDDEDPTATVLQRLEKENLEGTILKLKLIATPNQKKLFREIELKEILKKCYFYAGIGWEMLEVETKKLYDLEAKTEAELLKIYFERKKLGKKKIEQLISTYKRYFHYVSQAS